MHDLPSAFCEINSCIANHVGTAYNHIKKELSMKIIDLLNRETLSLSFEVFPPKTETSFESVKNATEEIAKLNRGRKK